jgi:SAM-dependent MidA family methyltransferase
MTALKQRIVRLIEAAGPISVAEYMALCLFDPEHGYYTTREPFGAAGDFTTAPEISQMFGELVAVWLYSAWNALGRPPQPVLAEIGPGRGTLMKDMLRTLSRLDKDFATTARVRMVETSPRLAEVQKATLAATGFTAEWNVSVSQLPEAPLLIVGNELFDALPVRQYVKTGQGWHERVVAAEDGELVFRAGPSRVDPALLPAAARSAAPGSIFELAPARTALMDEISVLVASRGGAGLFIDYGHAEPGIGDTLQAVRSHAYDDLLAHPGEADITSHVDFAALAAAVRRHDLQAHTIEQGEFLLAMGLLERAGSLGSGKDADEQERIRSEVERLAGAQAMGRLFKVMAVLPAGVMVAPFGRAH